MLKVPFDVNDASLRDHFLRDVLLEALTTLAGDARPRWGHMTSQEMVEHLLWAFEISTGRAEVGCSVPESRLPRFRAFLHDDQPTPREFRNPALVAGLPPLRYPGIEEAKTALGTEVDRFLQERQSNPEAVRTHPVFGPIKVELRPRAHFKQVYHHLLQFGLLGED